MKEIKTRDTVKDIRTLDRAASVAGRMKSAYVRTKEQAEQTQQANTDSPTAYAEDRTTESARNVARETGQKLHHQGKRFRRKHVGKSESVTRRKIRRNLSSLNMKKNPPKHNSKNPHLQTYPHPHMSRINLKISLSITPYADRTLHGIVPVAARNKPLQAMSGKKQGRASRRWSRA